MFGVRLCSPDLDDSVQAKEARLKEFGAKIQLRTKAAFPGIQFMNDFIEKHHIIEVLGRTSDRITRLCSLYAVQAAEQALTLAQPPGQPLPPNIATYVMANAGEKFLKLDLGGLQQMELICINNAFQVSDPSEFDTDDSDLAMVYTFLSQLMTIKKLIHGSHVAQLNTRGYDHADILLVAADQYVDDDNF